MVSFSKEITGTVEEEKRLRAEAAELQRKLRLNRLMRGDAIPKIEKDVAAAKKQADLFQFSMYSHSYAPLASTISQLCSHINDLLFLVGKED